MPDRLSIECQASNASLAMPKPPPARWCRECGRPFHAARTDQEFCKPTCRQAFHHRRQQRGAQLYDFAIEWRGKRLKGGFTRLCNLVDDWLAEERARKQAHKELRRQYEQGGHG